MKKIQKIRALYDQIKDCKQCPLSSGRIHAIPGEGDVNSRIFFIAQAPGKVEDKYGRMFLGPTGKVVDELFHEIQLKRNEVYMTNLIKCKLPKNRKPKQEEIELCSKYLVKEIEIVQPDIIIPMGYHASKFIFAHYCDKDMLPPDIVGKLFFFHGFKVYPLWHPTSIIYNPSIEPTMIGYLKKISTLI